jgi:DNA excision repair protein ERCC-2
VELDFSRREVRIGVGELAGFALQPQFGGGVPVGSWRLAVGRQWHEQIQAANAAAADGAGTRVRAEVTLEARWRVAGWTAFIAGRLDEVATTAEQHLLREIKTVRMALPADPGELRELYPEYFAQLSIYVELARSLPAWNDRPITGELFLVEIDEGFTQAVALDEGEAVHRFQRQLEPLGRFLRWRGEACEAQRRLPRKAPFQAWRPGQEAAVGELERARTQAPVVLFEAPTGFGKSGLALDHALSQMRAGRVSRLVLLTGKSSGQAPLLGQLASALGEASGLRYLQMRNRQELALREGTAENLTPAAMARRWREAGLELEDCFEGATARPERLRSLGERHGLDPHALARALLGLTDIWIGDYNYLFSPGASGVFRDIPGFDPAQTFLLVDEAHNLPGRAAGACSHRFEAADWHVLGSEFALRGWPPAFVRGLQAFAGFLDDLRPADRIDDELHFEGQGRLRALAEQIQRTPLPWEEAEPFAVERLWQLPAALAVLENDLLPLLSWAPAPGQWALTCLDASALTGPTLLGFGGVLLMSATLQPLDESCARLGLPSPFAAAGRHRVAFVEGQAPWREGAYRVAIDTRVDTRFAKRAQSLRRTAHAVIHLSEGQAAPVAVFFSSYRYAEDVARVVEWEAPHLRVALQPRGLDLTAQGTFLEESLLTAHALFLVLGSSFSEGIDQLGGRVRRAMVVGPALPEVNAVQEATREALRRAGHPDPFRAAYQIPGLTRIYQALGRLVRAPGHQADIVLHGLRFAQPAYFELLRPEFQEATLVTDDASWAAWLRETPR